MCEAKCELNDRIVFGKELHTPQYQAGVDTTKPERIGQDGINSHFFSALGEIVEIAFGIGMFEVDSRRQIFVSQGEAGNGGLK